MRVKQTRLIDCSHSKMPITHIIQSIKKGKKLGMVYNIQAELIFTCMV